MNPVITLDPGRHDRRDVPVEIRLPFGAPDGAWTLEPGGLVGQSAGGVLVFVVPEMKAGAALKLTAKPAKAPDAVTLASGDGVLAFAEAGAPVTTYHFGPGSPKPLPSRPYFAPLVHAGINLTREVADKAAVQPDIDHPHHKSLWCAFGSLNGSDCWDDGDHRGFTKHVSFASTYSGPVAAGFTQALRWEAKDGSPLLDEERVVRIWKAGAGPRLIDFGVAFRPAAGAVTFGDTKEGGICSLRVAEPLQGDKGGVIVNAHGGVGEADCWGHRSPWVDYHGTLKGKAVGMAILDHPRSFRFPTHWHVRDYGLFTANPFGWHDFKSGWSEDGSHVLSAGAVLPFRYRVILHEGDHLAARVAARWLDFAHPPAVTLA